jgi:hypothetical protein
LFNGFEFLALDNDGVNAHVVLVGDVHPRLCLFAQDALLLLVLQVNAWVRLGVDEIPNDNASAEHGSADAYIDNGLLVHLVSVDGSGDLLFSFTISMGSTL